MAIVKNNIVKILVGNTLYAFAVIFFIKPNNLITGGVTGLALALEHYSGWPLALILVLFNSSLFILGLMVLGKEFALKTLISTFYYPFILAIFSKYIGYYQLTPDPLIAAIFAGILIGSAIALVIRANASTGGMDIPPLILKKRYNIPIALSLNGFDLLILVIEASYTPLKAIFYGIILVLTYTLVLDKALLYGQAKVEVKIISSEYRKINEAIKVKLDRGTTLLKAESGYLQNPYPVILTIINKRELVKLKETVNAIDSEAFVIVAEVNEVTGRGFSQAKRYFKSWDFVSFASKYRF